MWEKKKSDTRGIRREDEMMIRTKLKIIHAIEMLEYHDKTRLSGDNKSRCEDKLLLLEEALMEVDRELEREGDTS